MSEFDNLITEMWRELSVRDFTVNDIDDYCARLKKTHDAMILDRYKVHKAELQAQQQRIAELEAQLLKVVKPEHKQTEWTDAWYCPVEGCGLQIRIDDVDGDRDKFCSECRVKFDWTEVEK